MHENLMITSKIFAVNFTVENFELFIFDNHGAQIHTEERSILLIKTYNICLRNIR